MKKKVLNIATDKVVTYVCNFGLVPQKMCDRLSVFLEEATRKGRPAHKGQRLPESYRTDCRIQDEILKR